MLLQASKLAAIRIVLLLGGFARKRFKPYSYLVSHRLAFSPQRLFRKKAPVWLVQGYKLARI